MVLFCYGVGVVLAWFDMVLIWFGYGVGIVTVLFWFGFGMVLVLIWHRFSMILARVGEFNTDKTGRIVAL